MSIAHKLQPIPHLDGTKLRGQRQAVATGKVIRFNPRVVLVDQPTANHAVKEAGRVLELMVKLKAESRRTGQTRVYRQRNA